MIGHSEASAVNHLDRHYMMLALGVARRGLGLVSPNPSVGCVIVAKGDFGPRIVGRGWTQPGGRPHAETEALAAAGKLAKGADVYVTLEPCAHSGKTPPCAGALIAAGVGRVIVATEDPDPRVSGAGIALLQKAGIETIVGVAEAEARALNEGFFRKINQGRPMITMKVATSLDGMIATAAGASQWITGPEARGVGHLLRAQNDALLTGVGTVIHDNPALTCRLPGLEAASPIRVVIDSWLRLPEGAEVTQTARTVPTWVVTLAHADAHKKQALERHGVKIIEVKPGSDDRPDLTALVEALAARGITRLLLESGGMLNTAFLKAGLIDHIAWFRAPVFLGGDGIPVIDPLEIEALGDAPGFIRENNFSLGADLLETYRRAD